MIRGSHASYRKTAARTQICCVGLDKTGHSRWAKAVATERCPRLPNFSIFRDHRPNLANPISSTFTHSSYLYHQFSVRLTLMVLTCSQQILLEIWYLQSSINARVAMSQTTKIVNKQYVILAAISCHLTSSPLSAIRSRFSLSAILQGRL